jgi:hypothetical protein
MGCYVTIDCDECGAEYSEIPPISYAFRVARDEYGWRVNMRSHSATCPECLLDGDDDDE